ncbi:hypothetical protein JCM5350_003981 [Sporobolomyces pararoseus]
MDPTASTSAPVKPKKQRASTSTKNRARSPSPYRSTAETSPEDFMQEFWNHTLKTAENHEDDFKHQALPLARIKKVAKMDPDMISSEVTVLFEKACQIFIQELTARAHMVSIESKRRTISRTDVAQAVSKSDTFDFLIDIVPREERAAAAVAGGSYSNSNSSNQQTQQQPPPPQTQTSHSHQTRTSINVPNVDLDQVSIPIPEPLPVASTSTTTTTTTSSSSRRPARARKISEKARQAEQSEQFELNRGEYRPQQQPQLQDQPIAEMQFEQNQLGAGGGEGTSNMFFNDDQSQLHGAEMTFDNDSQQPTKRPRLEGGDGENGFHHQGGQSGGEGVGEEEEELETDGAFEGWAGLELGFK